MSGYKKAQILGLIAVFCLGHRAAQAIKIVNNTPEAMIVIAQFAQASDRQDLVSNLAGWGTAQVRLTRVPNSIYGRDAAFSWTNIPQIAVGNRSLEQLNNATLTISPVTAYRKNGAWDIKFDLAFAGIGQQAQVESKAVSAAAAGKRSDEQAMNLWESEWLASLQQQTCAETKAQAERPAWLSGVERQVGRPLEVRPASEAPAHIQAAIRAHQASLGGAQETKVSSQDAELTKTLQTLTARTLELQEKTRAALQEKFATAKSIRQLRDGTWLVILPGNTIKIVDATGKSVIKTIAKGRVQ